MFLLDTGLSMAATIQNENLVTNIRPSATNPTTMTTNAGTRTMTKDATIPGLGDVKFDSEFIVGGKILNFTFFGHKIF